MLQLDFFPIESQCYHSGQFEKESPKKRLPNPSFSLGNDKDINLVNSGGGGGVRNWWL